MLGDLTAAELTASYDRTRSMLLSEQGIEASPLLTKPLEAGHEGHDEWGNPVYLSAADPSYQVLRNWAFSMEPALPPPAPEAGVADPGVVP